MAEYPENYIYQSSDKTLHWDGVQDAEEYRIEFTTNPQQTQTGLPLTAVVPI